MEMGRAVLVTVAMVGAVGLEEEAVLEEEGKPVGDWTLVEGTWSQETAQMQGRGLRASVWEGKEVSQGLG